MVTGVRRSIGFALLLGASVAMASVPFGGDDTGTIPSDAPKGPVTKCENKVTKLASKLVVAILKCHTARASGKLATDTAEEQCEATAETKFEAVKLTGCNSCTALTTLATEVEGLVDSNNKSIYCTAQGAAFGSDDSGRIPPDAPTGPVTVCENNVAKAVGKLVIGIEKCHADRAAGKLTDDTTEDQCEATVETKFETTKVTGCTSCTVLSTLASSVEKTYDQANNLFYCAP